MGLGAKYDILIHVGEIRVNDTCNEKAFRVEKCK